MDPTRQDLINEAGRRGILPPDKQKAFDLATDRGLIGGVAKVGGQVQSAGIQPVQPVQPVQPAGQPPPVAAPEATQQQPTWQQKAVAAITGGLGPAAGLAALPATRSVEEEQAESSQLMEMIGNIPGDAWETARQTVYPVTNWPQFKQGVISLFKDPEARTQVWNMMKERYGGVDNLNKYRVENPVQFGMDLSTVLGGFGLLNKVGILGKVAEKAGKIGAAIDPVRVATTGTARVVKAAIEKTGLADKLYESAMKIPPMSLKLAEREKVIHTLLREEKLPLTKTTVTKMSKRIALLDDTIDAKIKVLSDAGSDMSVNEITTALDTLKGNYASRSDPSKYNAVIDRVKDEYINHSFVNGGKLSLDDAMQLKKAAYQEIAAWYKKGQKPETGRIGVRNQVDAVAKAEAARVMRKSMLDNPDVPLDIKDMLRRESGLMNARKWVERATNRGGNLDITSLGGMMFGMLVDKGVPGLLAFRIISTQGAKTRLAVMLANKSKRLEKIGGPIRAGTLGTFQAGRMVGELEYEYNNEQHSQ